MSISDRVTILRDGKKVKDLVTAETSPKELSHFMIGRELSAVFRQERLREMSVRLRFQILQ